MTDRVGVPAEEERLDLADTIIRAWELSSVPFDPAHQIQLAMIAARFVIASRDVEHACKTETPHGS